VGAGEIEMGRTRTLWRRSWGSHSGAALERRWPYAWIGFFVGSYRTGYGRHWDVWVCLVPCFPVHVWWMRREK
jgi:hypothetical protein